MVAARCALDELAVGTDREPDATRAFAVHVARLAVTGVRVERPLPGHELASAIRAGRACRTTNGRDPWRRSSPCRRGPAATPARRHRYTSCWSSCRASPRYSVIPEDDTNTVPSAVSPVCTATPEDVTATDPVDACCAPIDECELLPHAASATAPTAIMAKRYLNAWEVLLLSWFGPLYDDPTGNGSRFASQHPPRTDSAPVRGTAPRNRVDNTVGSNNETEYDQ